MEAKQILLGISGGIAAYKSAELARLLVKAGHQVQVVMTEAACHFVSPLTFQALSGNPVYTDQWDTRPTRGMAHIDLSRRADVFLIAPASANTLFKLANGVCDNLLSTLAAARTCPLIIAPAMNKQMWDNPPNQRNLTQLLQDGVHCFGPASGEQACGETGQGRMLEPEEIAEYLHGFFVPKYLAGKRIVLTAGPTFEAIDAVRGISNISSGKMGYALAKACRDAGANVTLVSGPTGLPCPTGIERIDVTSALQMHNAVMQQIRPCDIFIAVAAVADYRVKNQLVQKHKKQDGVLQIALEENPDILASVAASPDAPFCVGFAAESQRLVEFAENKRRKKNVPMLIANLVQHAIGSDQNEVVILDDHGSTPLSRMDKVALAEAIVRHLAAHLTNRPESQKGFR